MLPPEQLTRMKHGLECWNLIVANAPHLRPADIPMLESLCAAHHLAKEAMEQTLEAGGPNPFDRRCKILEKIVRQQSAIALRLAVDLALTPMSRPQ